MIAIRAGHVVAGPTQLEDATVVVDDGRIVAVEAGPAVPHGSEVLHVPDGIVVPGFIDVHVHGVAGHDTLDDALDGDPDDGTPLVAIAGLLPRYGVTAFCPTTVACSPAVLDRFLAGVAALRAASDGTPGAPRARVLSAHLESNFINPEYAGAQPIECLRLPPRAAASAPRADADRDSAGDPFTAEQILAVIGRHRADVGAVTVAPELDGGLDLVRALARAGHCVSLGHTGADYEIARAAIDAGARRATHLFNRMTPFSHRAPGVVGAALERDEVDVELIADGVHVHPAMCRAAIAAKGPGGVMATSDGTAAAGLAVGAITRLGSRRLHVRSHAAVLDDGTLAGSTATMQRVFRTLVTACGASLVHAATMCAGTPARHLGLHDVGVVRPGAVADLVVLGPDLDVRYTLIAGRVVYAAATGSA